MRLIEEALENLKEALELYYEDNAIQNYESSYISSFTINA